MPKNVKDIHGADTDKSSLKTPSDLPRKSTEIVCNEINRLVADSFALYIKTKNFHWHVSGPNFRDYHLLLDEQATEIYEMVDPLAERVRKLGHATIKSIGHISKLMRIKDNDQDFASPFSMLCELLNDSKDMAETMRKAHELCDKHRDLATASLLETYIDEAEKRTWFLYEAARSADKSGH